MNLVIGTRNIHKLREIRQILAVPNLALLSALDFPDIPEVIEDGDSFEANAIKKATALSLATGLWALADDSGLEVEALNGAPGVYSARFAGEPVSYEANNRKLLKLLEKETNRRARFRCVIALSGPTGKAQTVEGVCSGSIIRECRGAGGFGYDPLFVPDGYSQTFAELPAEQKNAISHRGRALRKAAQTWRTILSSMPPDWPE
jgi:XTP/dITP diphosphohydrolase